MALIQSKIAKLILSNGLVVLVNSVTNIPKVSMELWCHVGSKDEKSGKKGLAHLIEHMIFKGTQKLSESDINVISHKLSAYMNAFTSHDATAYVYQFPTQNWKHGIALLADCMFNARFDEEMLNSELKAVIQELKMGKDHYVGSLVDEMLSAMFVDHPYHYPIIGFKQDLWNLKRDALFEFYKEHYVPNNMVLAVVGDVTPEEVFAEVEKKFGSIPADSSYKREEFYHGKDLIAKSVTLHRDVQHPLALIAAVLPGEKTKRGYVFEVLSWVLGAGKGSRLTKRLVDDLGLVTEVQTFCYNMEDATPFFIYFEPKAGVSVDEIKSVIHEEIAIIIKDGLTQKELERATKKVKTGLLNSLESLSKRTSKIAESYVITGDENYIFNYTNYACDDLEKEIQEILSTYFLPSMMHTGQILPLDEQDKKQWVYLQELSDAEDAKILDGRVRNKEIEPLSLAHEIFPGAPKPFHFHRPKKLELSNGVKAFIYDNKEMPKIDLVLSLKALPEYDSEELPGLYNFVCDMLLEGTKNYPGTSIADKIEEYGMSLSVSPGIIEMSMLSSDFEKGLELLNELLTNATFEEKAIEKIRARMLTDLKFFWDDPKYFSGQLIKDSIYKDHPKAKNNYGTESAINKIKQRDLKAFYKNYFSPYGSRLAIVGDLHNYKIENLLEKTIGCWNGPKVESLRYSKISACTPKTIKHKINRDQITLAYCQPSITRLDKNYDKLVLFEEIFSSGGMASRLFQLRERSGLFYSISGSVAAGADEEPGIFAVKTIVSLDRLDEAEKAIKGVIDTVVDSITEGELENAKQSIINTQINNFATNKSMAKAFLAIDRYGFSDDYFDTRALTINAITLEEVKDAARKYLDSSKMITFKIGRV